MKKIFSAIIMAAIVTNIAQAQKTGTAIDSNENQQILAFQKVILQGVNKNADADKNVNSKAVKEFSKFCNDATNVYWETLADGTVASYTLNNKKGRRFYNKKGHLICGIFSCAESDLPVDIRNLVRNTYQKDYTITSVDEIKTSSKKFYFIYIENKTNFKKLSVCDGEIEVVQECFN
jgi:Ni/Co efflux regulator RcnB